MLTMKSLTCPEQSYRDIQLDQNNGISSTHPVVEELYAAITDFDGKAYGIAFEKLRDVESLKQLLRNQGDFEAKLEVEAPGLRSRILEDNTGIDEWRKRLANWDAIWAWNLASRWLSNRDDAKQLKELSSGLLEAEEQIRIQTEELVGLLSWKHFFERLKSEHAEALKAC